MAITADDEPGRADRNDVRRANLALVLRTLRERGPRSRARIAEDTGLTKASASSLVAELEERGLVRGGELEQTGHTGRPGLAYGLSGATYGVGVEIGVDYLSAVAVDLTGTVRLSRRLALDVRAAAPEAVLDAAADLVRQTVRTTALRGCRPVGLVVAAPGVVEEGTGRVRYASGLDWHDVEVGAGLRRRLARHRFPVAVDNDVKLAAAAEWACGVAAGTRDLAYLSGEAGVGAGLVLGGRLVRGARGFSGEIGHLPLDPTGRRCACGRRGCWETMVGLGTLLALAADPGDPVRDPATDVEARVAEIRARADAGDPRTLAALDRVGTDLGLGASVLVNMANPEVLVLGGYFALLGDHLLAGVTRELAARVIAPDLGGCRVALSTLGFTAAARGGAHTALERVFTDPLSVD
ncbi:ROK family protein [Actinokineospora soli]|uniref:ROK family protein n=1 Tax=Actinokineospora soli TaxID=1048753 RepID=A0ABW2TP94_9PSEU